MTEAEFTAHLSEVNRLLWYHARRLSRGRGVLPEDLHQSAALYLWSIRDKLATHPNVSGAFVTAGRWSMIRVAQKAKGQATTTLDEASHATALAYVDHPPDEFETIVGRIGRDSGRLLRRRYGHGDTLEAIAADEGITSDAVRHRIATALGHIRDALTA